MCSVEGRHKQRPPVPFLLVLSSYVHPPDHRLVNEFGALFSIDPNCPDETLVDETAEDESIGGVESPAQLFTESLQRPVALFFIGGAERRGMLF